METKVRKARDRFSHETDIGTEEKRSATNEAGESELGTDKVGDGKLTIEAYSSVKFKARMLDKGITKSSLETMQLPRKENLVLVLKMARKPLTKAQILLETQMVGGKTER